MSDFKDPVRWSEVNGDAPEQLQQLLHAARRDLPDAGEMQTMGLTTGAILAACATSVVGAGIGGASAASLAQAPAAAPLVGAGATLGTAGAQVTASGTFLTKVAIGVLLASGAGLWLTQGSEPESPGPVIAPSAAVTPAPVREVRPEIEASQVSEPAAAPPASAEIAGEGERAPPTSKAPPTKPTEVALLKQAQHALKFAPEQALALTRQHARLYPAGNLVQEREVIRIEALRRLGRASEAERVGDRFEERFPDSAHRSKVGTTDGRSKRAP
jgi:hypothetical protein